MTMVVVLRVQWRTQFFFKKGFRKFSFEKQPPEVFCKKGVLRNFVKFPGKHLRQSLLQASGLHLY